MNKQTRFHIGYWIVPRILGCWSCNTSTRRRRRSPRSPTASSSSCLRDRKVAEIGVSDRYIQGKLKEPLANGKSQFVTTRVDPQFADELQKYGVTYTGRSGKHAGQRPAVLGRCRSCCSSACGRSVARRMAPGPGRRADVDRQEQGEDLRGGRHRRVASTMSPGSTRPRMSCGRSSTS